jgi:hypothetical protein
MIKFREKKYMIQDLTNEVLDHLKDDGQLPNIINESEADSTSKLSSKSLVLYSFIRNESGLYELKLMDKQLYSFNTTKLPDRFGLRVINIDKDNRIITLESEYKGRVLDAIDVMGRMYKLSVVVR